MQHWIVSSQSQLAVNGTAWQSGTKTSRYHTDMLRDILMLSSFMYQNCLLRVVAVGQSDSSELSRHRVGKQPTLWKHAAIPVEWKHWRLSNFSHGITLPTASYEFTKFYNTLMKDLIDDYYAMITRRPCHGPWILRVNESWRFRSGLQAKCGLWSIGQKI